MSSKIRLMNMLAGWREYSEDVFVEEDEIELIDALYMKASMLPKDDTKAVGQFVVREIMAVLSLDEL